MSNPHVPPHNLEAEMAVLGAMMLGDVGTVERALAALTRGDFYRDAHGHIFDAAATLQSKNEAIDIVTLKDELHKRGVLSGIGGVSYLMQLADIQFTTANIDHYAKIVHEKSLLRRLALACLDFAASAHSEEVEVDALLEDAERRIMDIRANRSAGTSRTLKVRAGEEMIAIEHRGQLPPGAIVGLRTGFIDLDYKTAGFQQSDLLILAARPSVGKTALAVSITANVTKAGGVVVFFTLEMSGSQLTQRLLSAEGRVHSQSLRSGRMQQEDWQKLLAGNDRLWKGECIIDDFSQVSPAYVRSALRRIKAERGHIDLVVIDYIGLMTGGGAVAGRRSDTRNDELSATSRSLKFIAKEFEVPVLALSQLSRQVEGRQDKRPMLSDLRDSGSLEQDADVVLFLYRTSYQSDAAAAEDSSIMQETELIIRKQRNGPTGTIFLGFTPAYTRFDNMAAENYGETE